MSSSKNRVIVFEKSGVIDRVVNNVYSKTESEEIATKAKSILSKCTGKAPTDFRIRIFDRDIDIFYKPNYNLDKDSPLADANNKRVNIYKPVTKDNKDEMHYVLLHELTHVLQQIKTEERANEYSRTPINKMWERISYMLSINVDNALYFKRDSPEGLLSYLIYRLNKQEEYAWSNNMYIDAVREHERRILENRDTSIMATFNAVMKKSFVTAQDYNKLIKEIETGTDTIDEMIISDLISFFNEIKHSRIAYLHFDKSVFRIPEVMAMRNAVAKIKSSPDMNEEHTLYALASLAQKYTKVLQGKPEVMNKIKTSFISRMNRRFNEAYKRFTKAIMLGIDDANSMYRVMVA